MPARRPSDDPKFIRPFRPSCERIFRQHWCIPDIDWQPEILTRKEVQLSCPIHTDDGLVALQEAIAEVQAAYPNPRGHSQLTYTSYFQAFVPAHLDPDVGRLGFSDKCKIMQTNMAFAPTDKIPNPLRVALFFKLNSVQLRAIVCEFQSKLQQRLSSQATA